MSPQAPSDLVLAVDLDGTLIGSDMLHETFWSALARDPRTPVLAALALGQGRAALKRALAARAEIAVETLPYRAEVCARVEAWRAAGGRTALVTAADQALADRIAAHLGIFDEAHGSDGETNLKGAAKAAALTARFGARGFAYMGDAPADLAVWEAAGQAITVGADAGLRARAEALGVPVDHLEIAPPAPAAYLRALRPHQWLKNVLVFLPMLAAHQLTALTLVQSVLAFLAFSAVASAVYLLNDLLDLSADRAHPRKRCRPFASGAVPIAHGGAMAGGLLLLGGAVALGLGVAFLWALLLYLLITTAYSLALKRQVVIDICVLAGLYTMRLIAGGAATGIPLSVWLLAFSIFFFFALAAVKRQAELVDGAARGVLSASGRGYRTDDLPVVTMMALASGYLSVLVMALYVNAPAVSLLYSFPEALWGISAVLLYWISRMVLVTHRGQMHDDPVVFAVRDPVSLAAGGLILGLAVLASVL